MQLLNALPLLAFGPGHPWAHHGGFWPWAPVFFGSFWVLVIAAIAMTFWLVARRGWHRPMAPVDPTGRDRARAILAERFARGEISVEEFDERVSHLG